MLSEKTIRAWKDVEYRLSLSEAERAQLPDHPAGLAELSEKELNPVVGGGVTAYGCAPTTSTIWAVCHPHTAVACYQ